MPLTQEAAKHLDYVQAVISRMAGNSFLLKGWSVTLTAAILGLAAKESKPVFIPIALFPALAFWGLDAYYLRRERLFRKLYDDVRLDALNGTGKVAPFCMATEQYKADTPGLFGTMFCPAVIGLHGTVIMAIIAAFGISAAWR